MASKEEYDVLRLIEHGQTCYISSECVQGRILAGWVKEQPGIAKGRLFSVLRDIAGQLSMLHKCRKKPYYQYVNPYSIVITEEGKLYFLDMEAGSNERHLKFMQKRAVRECFLPDKEAYYRKASVELDIYGLGKTIQYIMSMAKPKPPLSKWEERKFQKIISKCLKYQSKSAYQNVTEIRRNIPQYRHRTRRRHIGRKRAFMIGGTTALLAAAWKVQDFVHLGRQPAEAEVSLAAQQEPGPEDMKKDGEEALALASGVHTSYMELAAAYALDIEDYEKSLYYLEKIQNEYAPARDLKEIVEAFLGERKDSKKLEMHLENMEKAAAEEGVSEEGKECFWRCLIKGYSLLNTRRSAESILRLGNLCLNGLDGESKEAEEVKEYMASAYEKTEETEKAALVYEELLKQMTDSRKRAETYRKIIGLYESCEQNDRAMEACIRGIEEKEDSAELKITHIRLMCQDASVGRELCARTIQGYIGQMPEIMEREEFQKLQREYEIQVEGDDVWVGR